MIRAASSEDRHGTACWRPRTSTEKMLLELCFVDRINLGKSQKMYYNILEGFMQQSELWQENKFCNFIKLWQKIKYQVKRKAEGKKLTVNPSAVYRTITCLLLLPKEHSTLDGVVLSRWVLTSQYSHNGKLLFNLKAVSKIHNKNILYPREYKKLSFR